MSTQDGRNTPRKIIQHLRHHYPDVPIDPVHDKEAWPTGVKSSPSATQVSWSITPEMALGWKKVRSEG